MPASLKLSIAAGIVAAIGFGMLIAAHFANGWASMGLFFDGVFVTGPSLLACLICSLTCAIRQPARRSAAKWLMGCSLAGMAALAIFWRFG